MLWLTRTRQRIAVVVGLVASYVLVFGLGTLVASDGPSDPQARTPVDVDAAACAAAERTLVAIDDAAGADEPFTATAAALVELRDAVPALESPLDVLIDTYTTLADGDLRAMGDPDHVDDIEASASELIARLEADCSLGLHTGDES